MPDYSHLVISQLLESESGRMKKHLKRNLETREKVSSQKDKRSGDDYWHEKDDD